MSEPKALLIIPMFNEEKRVNIHDYRTGFKRYHHIDFLLVDDASTDRTHTLIDHLIKSHKNVFSIKNKTNFGKAESIRLGVLHSRASKYDFIGYMDADLSVPFSEMVMLLENASKYKDKLFVMGSRIKLINNKIIRSKRRHYIGRVFATLISQFILKTAVYDTQCGAKIITSKLTKILFEKPFETKWLFDIELLLRLQKQNIDLTTNVLEVPLNIWIEKGDTKIKPHEFLFFPLQIMKLNYKYA